MTAIAEWMEGCVFTCIIELGSLWGDWQGGDKSYKREG